ncbi:MAG: GGDEF domain-containing protein [Thermodesulfobacteriota bacterium]
MDSITTSVLDIRLLASNDEKFIEGMNNLIDKEGDSACQAFFKLFTDLELPPYTARKNWFNIVDHREALVTFLGRDVNLVTVLTDYLSSSCHYFRNPKIIEFDTFEKVLKDSRHDNLTGLNNRGGFWEILKGHLAQAKRHNTELTILFLDVDNFKLFNDTYGHQAGDKALVAVADVIRQESRTDDVSLRYGGEEFVIIMPNTGERSALVLAERIRKNIEGLVVEVDGVERSVTISGGIASYPNDAKNAHTLLNKADKALYRSKKMGKNNISVFAEEKQRGYPRSKLIRPVRIKKIGLDATPPIHGASKNICMEGMLFETAYHIDVGSNIEVSIPVLNTNPLFLIGSVVRVDSEKKGKYDIGMAISFKEMEKAARDEISSFLTSGQTGIKVNPRGLATRKGANMLEM